ncbi:hypothetical protein LTR56_026302 [Elasticomyces elasticus]|nr:hypothetical protein LTR56_026302 [Elasticomyces elasticus]KAK3618280.1 hypothetical protein LTR22_026426 [Elasticomyces elasticus]
MSAPNLDGQSPDPEHQSDAPIGVISEPNNQGAKEDYESDKTSSGQWLNKLESNHQGAVEAHAVAATSENQ